MRNKDIINGWIVVLILPSFTSQVRRGGGWRGRRGLRAMGFFSAFLDLIGGSARGNKDKKDKGKGTKEEKKRRKEKEKEKEKRREPEQAKGSSEAKATSNSTSRTTSIDLRGPQPKSEVIEETSAMAQSDDPDDPKSWDYDDIDEAKPTFGQKIKDMADKSVRRVRRISSGNDSMASRPIKEKTLDRFMERVKARQEKRVKSAERILHDSECVFPESADVVRAESIIAHKAAGSRETSEKNSRRKDENSEKSTRRKEEGKSPSREMIEGKSPSREKIEETSKRKTKSPSREKEDETSKRKSKSPKKKEKKEKEKKEKKEKKKESTESTRSSRSDKSEKSSRRAKPSPLKQIQKIFPDLSKSGREKRREKKELKKREKEETIRRKNREKNLFVNGRPFWVTAGRMSAEEKAEMTQDDLPLNAAIILEVRKGNIDLPVLTDKLIKFDPYAPLDVLKGRDETLFNHKMLFANTIRSMINSADYISTEGTTGETATGETPHRVKRPEFKAHPTFFFSLVIVPSNDTIYRI
ncbi:hypothetical protein PRIPAC_83541 [Pristionchus pacificus]|uniref:Uncharacterized protein n=1 Tax=Pristionchus pacificus TaxID=54126 RepID=A0A2A6BVC1_PRIPA|nr:hypothetical protein PRIPAC_83541 [Pristionchus pacificus]|eukprot:PDM69849.1 hypothetical protein PRIPAC_49056 [Pristionchus pacificus]